MHLLQLRKIASISSQRRRKWLLLLTVFGFSGYGVYRVYNSPYIARTRNRLLKLFRGIVFFAELVIDSAETISIVSRELKDFLESESDEIPNSCKQLSKITKSKEFTDSLARVSEAVTIGVLGGYKLDEKSRISEVESGIGSNSSVVDRLLNSESGTGFVSVVVGSFAKNLVLGSYQIERDVDSSETTPRLMSLLRDDKCRELLADCIERITRSTVSIYVKKTSGINTYDQIFSGLTNPKHRDTARDVLVSVCNGALETYMRTSFDKETERRKFASSSNGWAEAISTILAEPSNRKFMFDVTGRVTLETMRSIVVFVIMSTSQSFRRSFNVLNEEVIERGRQVVGYLGAKSSIIITFCLAVYIHIINRCGLVKPAFLI